ncbi:MAG: hypothetical protein ACKVU0_05280 [Saprospiraceae bacterium]
MDISNTLNTISPLKKMPASVFELIWRNIPNASAWEDCVKFDTFQGIRRVSFYNVEIEEVIRVENTQEPLLHLILSNCSLSNCELSNAKARTIVIQQNSTIEGLKIQDSTIGDVMIEDSQTGSVEIITSKTGRFRIEDSKIAGYLNVSESITESFDIINSTVENFLIRRKSIIRNLWFVNSKAEEFKIIGSKAIVLCFKKKSKITKTQVYHSDIELIEVSLESFIGLFQCSLSLRGPVLLLFTESSFGQIELNNSVFSEFTTMRLSDCLIVHLSIINFCNYGSIFFSNLKPLKRQPDFDSIKSDPAIYENETSRTIINLSGSDLGKAQFINCDLREFNRFEFSNTKMLDVFVAGSQMPNDSAFCLPNNEKNPLKIAEQKRLAYGQFKKIYEARGDTAGSLPYLAFEMEAYRQQLQMEGWWKNRGELAMLWSNKLSTNYGVSWQRGLGVTFLAVIFFYSIFCYLIGYRFENNSPDDVDRFWEVVSYAPYYLNPLRDMDSVFLLPDKDFTPAARFWDFISRIFVAYFVYQTIQAFRKLGKSSG